MQTALEVHNHITAYAKTASPEVRFYKEPFRMRDILVNGKKETHPEWARQGDVYFVHIKAIPENAKRVALKDAIQLAQGQTVGSRHMLRAADGVAFYRLASPTPLDGGYIESDGRCYIEHPEHAHLDLPPGKYAVTYQRDLGAEELRAVRD